MIEVKGVNKSFGENHVLKDINTEFKKGVVNMIIGQSGQGKSVLTKCIVGLHQPNTGSISYDGRDFTSMSRIDKKSIRKEIGMLFQVAALFDSMTVEENIMFPLTMFTNQTKKEKLDRVTFVWTVLTCKEEINCIQLNVVEGCKNVSLLLVQYP